MHYFSCAPTDILFLDIHVFLRFYVLVFGVDDVPPLALQKDSLPHPSNACARLPALVCANFVSFTLQVHTFRKVHFASQQRWYHVISPTLRNTK